MKPLVENEFLIHVDYDNPAYRAKPFSGPLLGDLFNYEWEYHPSCVGIDQTTGDRVMLVKGFGCKSTSQENIAEMERSGYRPATHIEARAFMKSHPELQFPFWVLALGSYYVADDERSVAELSNNSGGVIMEDYDLYDRTWDSDRRFLFVRK